MSDVTPELLSVYADGEATRKEVSGVEAALAGDPAAQKLLEELKNLEELFCPTETAASSETVSDSLKERLYGLGLTAPLKTFTPVKMAPAEPRRWRWPAAIAAAVLVTIGLQQLLYRPQVIVTEFTRQVVDARGNVLKTERLEQVTMRAGDVLTAKSGERISCRLPGGATVVLLGGSRIKLGDPRDREIFELDEGTALCTILESSEPRFVHAAGYEISADRASFGIRVREPGALPAGPAMAATPDAEVTVAVSRGSLQVGRDGNRETVRAGARIVLRAGTAERSFLWQDPLYAHLMRNFRVLGREILPGFFNVETGVTSIPGEQWGRERDGSRQLVLGSHELAYAARYLVLYARASKPTALRATLVVPDRKRPGRAETRTITTATVGTEWTVISVARKAFDAVPKTERKTRKIPVSRSRLSRLELRPAEREATFELKASLWAARPPAGLSSEVGK